MAGAMAAVAVLTAAGFHLGVLLACVGVFLACISVPFARVGGNAVLAMRIAIARQHCQRLQRNQRRRQINQRSGCKPCHVKYEQFAAPQKNHRDHVHRPLSAVTTPNLKRKCEQSRRLHLPRRMASCQA